MDIQNSCCEKFENCEAVSCEAQLPKFLQSCIGDIITKENFIRYEVQNKQISTGGGNYLGVLYEVDIKGKTKNGDKEINLFVKSAPQMHENLTEFFSLSDAYLAEIYFYKELTNIFTHLQDNAGVPLEERFKHVRAFEESSSEAIILENLARKGFNTLERMKMIPLKFAKLSIQQLAKFHTLGFIIEKKLPDYFENTLSRLRHPTKFNVKFEAFTKSTMDRTIKNMKEGPLKKKAEAFAQSSVKTYVRYLEDKTLKRTLCYGDFRLNNILVKELDGEITEVIPIDYQLINYGCPVMDILYFIYGCTDQQFRRSHMKDLIELYHETMKNFLKYFEIDICEVYSRKELNIAIKERDEFPLIVALVFYPFFFATEDNVPDISKDMLEASVRLDPQIMRRVEEIIEDLEDSGVL